MAAREEQAKSRQPRKRSDVASLTHKQPAASSLTIKTQRELSERRKDQAHRAPTTTEIEKRGRSWSRKLMSRIVAEHGNNGYVAFEISSGDYVVADSKLELVKQFEKKFGDEWGWVERVQLKHAP